MSSTNSGGAFSIVVFTQSTIFIAIGNNTFNISSLDISISTGKPVSRFLPLTFTNVSDSIGYTHPTLIFISSAVLSPINTLYFFLTYFIIASSNLFPAIFIDELTTEPPIDITATSVVPPPISTTRFPDGLEISIPAPIAAATGSSIK